MPELFASARQFFASREGVRDPPGYSPPPMPTPPVRKSAQPQPPAQDLLAQRAEALARATTKAHRSVLILIAACLLAIMWFGGDTTSAQPRMYTYAAVGLGVATIAARRFSTSPVLHRRNRLLWAMTALGCAALLALVAAAIGIEHGDKQAGLVIALGAAIFIVRAPEAAALPGPPRH